MILVIDNYDSFTYNLVQYLGEMGCELQVWRNDALTLEQIHAMRPERMMISPGPCTPNEAGISLEVVREFSPSVPILGVCLGHQAIGQVYGGTVCRAPYLMHGKPSQIHHNGTGIFAGIPSPMTATRYHSLIVQREGLPDELEITAETADGLIMALQHRRYPTVGVQFHPESILTTEGKRLLKNFLAM